MKRFIDLRGQVYNDDDLPIDQQTPCFAYFCTVVDKFETFGGCQTWSSFHDFTSDYLEHVGSLDEGYARLAGLTPAWALAIDTQKF